MHAELIVMRGTVMLMRELQALIHAPRPQFGLQICKSQLLGKHRQAVG